ncbi:hypothetical protein KIPB_014721, partial [Kipferlia bialata]|eukprot:g14721.t1
MEEVLEGQKELHRQSETVVVQNHGSDAETKEMRLAAAVAAQERDAAQDRAALLEAEISTLSAAHDAELAKAESSVSGLEAENRVLSDKLARFESALQSNADLQYKVEDVTAAYNTGEYIT